MTDRHMWETLAGCIVFSVCLLIGLTIGLAIIG